MTVYQAKFLQDATSEHGVKYFFLGTKNSSLLATH